MKMKGILFLFILVSVLSFGACERSNPLEGQNAETESGEEKEPEQSEETERLKWVNHYYNRGLYEKDGFIYRQFSDGLYRRQKGSGDWEQLCEVPINLGRGLTGYGDRLYFTCCPEDGDAQSGDADNTLFYLDLNTMESGELLSEEGAIITAAVYEDCLYIQRTGKQWVVYEGYRLNGDGEIAETLDPEENSFLCRFQNEYNRVEAAWNLALQDSEKEKLKAELDSMKKEVISAPACAAMLDGKILLQQEYAGGNARFFLRDVETGQEEEIFTGYMALAVMPDGICYVNRDRQTLKYYSFEEKTEEIIQRPQEWETAALYEDYNLTYDRDYLYLYDSSTVWDMNTDEVREYTNAVLTRTALGSWDGETVLEFEEDGRQETGRVNQTDGEYFYHGDRAFRLAE